MLKYKINHYLSSLPMDVSIQAFAKRLNQRHNISPEDFFADRWLRVTDDFDIPTRRLYAYAIEFGVTEEDLYSDPSKAKQPQSGR